MYIIQLYIIYISPSDLQSFLAKSISDISMETEALHEFKKHSVLFLRSQSHEEEEHFSFQLYKKKKKKEKSPKATEKKSKKEESIALFLGYKHGTTRSGKLLKVIHRKYILLY